MPSQEIISVNLWQILISLCNLLLLFLILKRFLFKPVQKMLAKRRAAIDEQYDTARQTREEADAYRAEWEQKHAQADEQAEEIRHAAIADADRRREQILDDARERSATIVRQAEEEARRERENAADRIRAEIVDVSALMAENVLRRSVTAEDHRQLIDSFLNEVGDADD